ncbi:MAG: DnaJ family domain-containing protein [Gammaproteobacteria bacterium]
MWLIDQLAEARIGEARDRGDFDNLAGAGRPLVLDDDLLVPEELRVAYRLLKNAGFVPPELEARREIAHLQQLVDSVVSDEQRAACLRRLNFLLARLGSCHGRELSPAVQECYFAKLQQRLGTTD